MFFFFSFLLIIIKNKSLRRIQHIEECSVWLEEIFSFDSSLLSYIVCPIPFVFVL